MCVCATVMMPAGVAAEGRASRGGARGDTEGEGEGWSATVDTCSCRCWPGTTRALASRVCLLAATAAASTFALARPSRRVPRRKDRKTEEGGGRHPRVSERRNGLLFARQHRRRFISFMNHTVGKLNNDASDLVDRRENDKKKLIERTEWHMSAITGNPSSPADIPGMAMLALQ